MEHRIVVPIVGLRVRVQGEAAVLPLRGVTGVVLVGVLGSVVVPGRVHAFSMVMLPVAMGVVLIGVGLVVLVVVRNVRVMVVREIGVLGAHWA